MNKYLIHKAYILFLSGVKDENGIVRIKDEHNQIIGVQFINNSSKDYIVYCYYDNGKIWYQQQYKNNKWHGDYIEYYENGKICYQEQYKNNKHHGDYAGYYEDGKIWYQQQYKNDKLHGNYVDYYDNGQISYQQQYKNGELIG